MRKFALFLEEYLYKFNSLWDVGSLPSFKARGKKYLPYFDDLKTHSSIVLRKQDINPETLSPEEYQKWLQATTGIPEEEIDFKEHRRRS